MLTFNTNPFGLSNSASNINYAILHPSLQKGLCLEGSLQNHLNVTHLTLVPECSHYWGWREDALVQSTGKYEQSCSS